MLNSQYISAPLALAAALFASVAAAQDVPTQLTPVTAISSFRPVAVISGDGRYSVFRLANVSGSSEGNIFLLDRDTQAMQQVDITPSGAPSSPKSGVPVISGNGRYVLFSSIAPEMGLTSPPSYPSGYFVRDLQLGVTLKVASASWTAYPKINKTAYAGISYNGRYVVYRVEGNTAASPSKLYVWDMVTQTSTATTAPDANFTGLYERLSISDDGRYIGYKSLSTAGATALWVHDRETGLNERIDVNTAGQPAPNNTSRQMSMSRDGNIVAFESTAPILSPGGEADQNYDIYVRNRAAATTERISFSYGSQLAQQCSISPDGRFVAYYGRSTPNGKVAMWVYDTLARAARGGYASKISTWFTQYPSLSDNGRYLTMYTHQLTSAPHIATLDYGDPAAVVLSTNNVAVTEGGIAATYGVSLSRQPSADVKVTVKPDNQLQVTPAQLTFTSANWDVPQLVSVQAVQDTLHQGLHYGAVLHSPASGDPFFAVASAGAVQAAIRDAVPPVVMAPGEPGRPLQSGDVTLNGTAVPGAMVLLTLTQVASGDVQAVSVTADAEGWWLYTFFGLANGGYAVAVQADGIQGNTVGFSVYLLQ
ncbi:hypothetical protein [Hyalangium versicolor]|uniref:hypothetical protein n=1 Tax=Hyalangium versicolor TaxID=2861190 RepID=UPI001CCAC26C|nr:hypothetical protein [Hyalangium versicolor]